MGLRGVTRQTASEGLRPLTDPALGHSPSLCCSALRPARRGGPACASPFLPGAPRPGALPSSTCFFPAGREICKAAYQKIQDLRAELDAKWATYKEQNALFRVQLAEDRKRRQEEYLKQKAERDAERAGAARGALGRQRAPGRGWGPRGLD